MINIRNDDFWIYVIFISMPILMIPYLETYGIIVLFLYSCIRKKISTFKVKIPLLLLGLYSVFYFLFDSYFINWSILQKLRICIYIPLMFFLGSNYGYGVSTDREQDFNKKIFIAVGAAYFLLIAFAYVYSIKNGFSFTFGRRLMLNPWGGSTLGATHIGSMSLVAVGLSVWGLLRQKWYYQVASLTIIALLLFVNSNLGNRMIFLLAPMLLLLGIYLKIRTNKNKLKTFLKIFVLFTLVAVIAVICWSKDYFGIRTWFYQSNVYLRLQEISLDDPRGARQLYIIKHFFENVLGGSYFSKLVGNPHNLWLNTYDSAGIVPFIFLIAYTICVCIQLYKCVKTQNQDTSMLLILINVSFFLAFATEPIMESVDSMIWISTFLQGLLFRTDALVGKNIQELNQDYECNYVH